MCEEPRTSTSCPIPTSPTCSAYAQLDADASTVDLETVSVRICSLEALLAMKRASTRARDRDDLEALEAAHGDAIE